MRVAFLPNAFLDKIVAIQLNCVSQGES
jgi:hypothetical protein